MRNVHSVAAMCAILIGTMPVAAFAQANHNTARSNKSTVAAPAGGTAPAVSTGQDQPAGESAPDGSVQPIAKANHNTARSNKNTVAAPNGDVATGVGARGEANARKKGYEYYQARSDLDAPAAGPEGIMQPAEDEAANVTVPKLTQGATFGEKVNAGLHAAGGALSQGTAAQAPEDGCKTQTGRDNAAAATAPGQPGTAGEIKVTSGKPDACPSVR